MIFECRKNWGTLSCISKKQIHSAFWDVEISTPNLATLSFPNPIQNYSKRLNHSIKSKEMANDSKLTAHNL